MAKRKNEEKERYWRAVLQRQTRSGVSIAKFCRSEGVSEPSFYSWKRALDGSRVKSKTREPSGTRRVAARTSEASPSFVPVQITEEASSSDDPGHVAQWAVGASPSRV